MSYSGGTAVALHSCYLIMPHPALAECQGARVAGFPRFTVAPVFYARCCSMPYGKTEHRVLGEPAGVTRARQRQPRLVYARKHTEKAYAYGR
jgi:hypothetical protein